jgi:hypothetical protein
MSTAQPPHGPAFRPVPARRARRVRRGALVLAGAVLGGLVLGACGSDYSYLSHDSSGLYYRLPESWTALSLPEDDESSTSVSYLRVLDSASDPSLAHLDQVGDSPVGVVQVLDLSPAQRDTLSLSTLRELATNGDGDPFDLQEEAGSGLKVLRYRDLEVEGGYKGSRIAFSRTEDDGSTVVTEQLALLAPNSDRIYQVIIHCSETCFSERKSEIDVVLDSWNVRAS